MKMMMMMMMMMIMMQVGPNKNLWELLVGDFHRPDCLPNQQCQSTEEII